MDELWYELTEEGRRAKKRIVIFKCALMLFSILLFLIGFFKNIGWLSLVGGCLIVIYDILDILAGFLKPLFPIIFAIILASIIKPWYIGIFWASAIWHIIGSPWYVTSLFSSMQSTKKRGLPPSNINKSNEGELERMRKLKRPEDAQ